MLVELHVRGLGVIEDARVVLAEGLTALTGETGAGKTLLVDALDLVLGGKPRRGLVPPGGAALVEAVFLDKGEEVILAREVPADGRARAWIDGRMSSVASLEERARGLCDNMNTRRCCRRDQSGWLSTFGRGSMTQNFVQHDANSAVSLMNNAT